MTKPTNKKLAEKYSVHPKTISAWRSEGAPLDDARQMKHWLASRHRVPAGLAGATEPDASITEGPQTVGSPAALTRLEAAELQAHNRLQRALASGDPLRIKTARNDWLTTADALRHFERAVSADARAKGELVSRVEVLRGLSALGHCLRLSAEAQQGHVAAAVKGCEDAVDVRQLLRRCGWGAALVSFGALESFGCPEWMRQAITEDLTTQTNITQADIHRVSEIIKEAASAEAEMTIADHATQCAADAARYSKPSAPVAAESTPAV